MQRMTLVAATALFSIAFAPSASAGFDKPPKRAQTCSAPAKTVKQTTLQCPPGGALVLTRSSHPRLKQNQLDGHVCVAHPVRDRDCAGAYFLFNLTDVRSWAGAFCNWVYTYHDRAGTRQTFACMQKPKRR